MGDIVKVTDTHFFPADLILLSSRSVTVAACMVSGNTISGVTPGLIKAVFYFLVICQVSTSNYYGDMISMLTSLTRCLSPILKCGFPASVLT